MTITIKIECFYELFREFASSSIFGFMDVMNVNGVHSDYWSLQGTVNVEQIITCLLFHKNYISSRANYFIKAYLNIKRIITRISLMRCHALRNGHV